MRQNQINGFKMSIVFFSLAAVAILVALHPYISYPISLYLLSKLRSQPYGSLEAPSVKDASTKLSDQPRLAVLLCVHNEERDIRQRIDDLLSQSASLADTQILIYSDGSSDNTVEVLQTYGSRITVLESSERRGKTYGMNALVEIAQAELLVFTDATVRMGPHALTNLIIHFQDPAIGCVCAQIIAHDHSVDESSYQRSSSTADTSVKSWAFDASIRRMETQVASAIGAHGPLFAIRRELHNAVPIDLIDDFYLSMSILFSGHRVVQAENVVGFKTVAKERKDEYERKVRIACQAFNVHRAIRPALKRQPFLIQYLYAGHKTMRWTTIYSLFLAAIFSVLTLISAGFITLVIWISVLVTGSLLLGYLGIKPFNRIIDVLLPFVANGIGIIKSLQGKKYQTWSSAASARDGASTN